MVPLGEVLRPVSTAIPVDKLAEVNLAGVYSFGRGLFSRGRFRPAESSYSYYNELYTDDFVISQPKAWEGAIARVSQEFCGWFLSPVFPTFRVVPDRLDPAYLEWFLKREPVWAELRRKSRGIGARRESVSPDQFLTLMIPLPPLEEQRRVVAKISRLDHQVGAATLLRQKTARTCRDLVIGMSHRRDLGEIDKHLAGWQRMPLEECLRLVDESQTVSANRSYPNVGIFSYGRGLFQKPPIDGGLTSAKALRRIRAGQFVYSRLFAFEGAYGMVPEKYDGCFVSAEYPTFACEPSLVRVEFLASYFQAPFVWAEIARGSKGLGDRRQRVQPSQVLKHSAWIPPIPYQERLAETVRHGAELAALHTECDSMFDALIHAVLHQEFDVRP